VVWLSQTSLSANESPAIIEMAAAAIPEAAGSAQQRHLLGDPQNRQVAVKAMAPECELVIVVGSRDSSNSVRLVDVAKGGSAAAYLVDRADATDPAWLEGVTTVGVTSGASVPEVLV
jgi:4-hydroxy-3-methylbut-2-enyl diphosphate reductase